MYIPVARSDHEREGTTAPGVGSGTEAGASGSSSGGGYSISTGGLIAIVVVVVAVAILGGETGAPTIALKHANTDCHP